MRQTVNRILEGKFDYEKGSLDFSVQRIELTLRPGESKTGSFVVSSRPGRLVEGTVYSKDLRMKLYNDVFSGESSEIGYSFDAKGLEEGDVCQGEIYIISNQGEYYLPYVATIAPDEIITSLGGIRNLFHFTNLAKSNWDEACKLFYQDEFTRVFVGNDRQYLKAYYGLSHYYGNEQNVEEFLLEINKKHAVEYIVDESTLSINNPEGLHEEYIQITRNGWGYTRLHVETDADFITLSIKEISDNEFLGNYLSYPITIDSTMLHEGMNYGRVRFFNAFTSFHVDISVMNEGATKMQISKEIEMRHLSMEVLTLYIALRTKKIKADTWLAETKKSIDRMSIVDGDNLNVNLYKAQLLMSEDRFNEAKWILDKVEDELKETLQYNTPIYGYYLYLTTLYNREDSYVDEIAKEVQRIYDNNPQAWQLAWMLLYLSEEFAISPSRKWLFIEQQISMQCKSPVMYVEAVNMLLNNPALLTKLTNYEIEILRFATKNYLFSKDLMNQFLYLVSKEKEYKEAYFSLLKYCYDNEPSKEVITAIAELLIKGDKKGPEYFQWYKLAIEEDARVTKLYEYFMMSIDLASDVKIPKMVYLYFAYQSELSYEYTAYIYARVIQKKEEMPDIFITYKEMIERFAVKELENEHINKDLAVIYRFSLPGMVLTNELAKKACRLIFVNRISVPDKKIRKVIIYQEHECVEYAYPVVNGEAFVPIYNRDYTILLEDAFSNRYMKSVNYEIEKLIVPGKLASILVPYVHDNLEFLVYTCECSSEMVEIKDETKDKYRYILDAIEIEEEYKSEIRLKLIQYYYDNDEIRELDEILEKIEPDTLPKHERVLIIRYLILRGMFDKAVLWIADYGLEGIDIKDLLKLISRLILRSDFTESPIITMISATLFYNGKYDENIIRYLSMYYKGMTKDMRKLYKAGNDFEIEISHMCENLLVQMLYTGYFVPERMDVYKTYISGGANSEIQMAFLTQCSFEYFVKEQLMEPFVFEEITKATIRGEKIQTVSKLAYIKYFSEEAKSVSDDEMAIISRFIDELLKIGIYMSFFKDFVERATSDLDQYSDKTIIEYKTDPNVKVYIHYVIEGDEDIRAEYITEEMPDMFGGVHARAFILFFGENLQYYITEERDGEELLTESGSIQKSDISHDVTNSRFNEINDIVIAKTLQDYTTVNNLLYDYRKHDFIVSELFKIQ